MLISGVITTAEFRPTKKDPSKTTMVFSFAPDDGGKHEDWYANNNQLQAEVTANLNRHVTIEYEMAGKWKNIKSITESEAPKQAPQQEQVVSKVIPNQFVTERQKQDSIEQQNALTNGCNLLIAGHIATDSVLARDLESLIRARIPYNAPTIAVKAPAPASEGMETVMANGAQLFNIRKWCKAKSEPDLLVKAEGRVKRDLTSLQDLTFEEAASWLEELAAAKK